MRGLKSGKYLEQIEDTIIQQQLRIEELENENLKLKKKLAFYEGPHTPPSIETLKKKKKDEKKPMMKKTRCAKRS